MNQTLPLQTRLARIERPSEAAAGTALEVVWSTGAQVRRYDFWADEVFMEELDLTGADLARFNAGAPVLNSHQAHGLNNVIGVVDRAWVDGGQGHAEIRLSDRPEVAGIRADIAAGILRNVSIGYAIHGMERQKAERKGEPDVVRVTRFEPLELSIVPVPADAGAQLRRDGTPPEFPVTIRGFDMSEEHVPGPATPPENTPAPLTEEQIQLRESQASAQATATERARVGAITDLCSRVRRADLAPALIAEGSTLEQARAALVEAWAQQGGAELRHAPDTGGQQATFESEVAALVALGKTRGAAIRAVAQSHPDLHTQYLSRINGRAA
jgi:hypothetical protein